MIPALLPGEARGAARRRARGRLERDRAALAGDRQPANRRLLSHDRRHIDRWPAHGCADERGSRWAAEADCGRRRQRVHHARPGDLPQLAHREGQARVRTDRAQVPARAAADRARGSRRARRRPAQGRPHRSADPVVRHVDPGAALLHPLGPAGRRQHPDDAERDDGGRRIGHRRRARPTSTRRCSAARG